MSNLTKKQSNYEKVKSSFNSHSQLSTFSNLTTIGAIAGGLKGATEALPGAIDERGLPVQSSIGSRLTNVAVNAGLGAGAGYVSNGLLKNMKAGKYDHIINPLREKAQPYIDRLPSIEVEIARKPQQASQPFINDLTGINIPKL